MAGNRRRLQHDPRAGSDRRRTGDGRCRGVGLADVRCGQAAGRACPLPRDGRPAAPLCRRAGGVRGARTPGGGAAFHLRRARVGREPRPRRTQRGGHVPQGALRLQRESVAAGGDGLRNLFLRRRRRHPAARWTNGSGHRNRRPGFTTNIEYSSLVRSGSPPTIHRRRGESA